jgi:acyl-CoA thioester hydrolase
VEKLSEFRLKRRVQFYETDAAGIVHFSNYFRYMEEAEHALWRAAGLSIAPDDALCGWPRVAVSCDYRSPLAFEDEFDVVIRVAAMSDKSIRYACVLTLGETVVATMSMTAVCVANGPGPLRAVAMPAVMRERFQVSDVVA